LIGGSGPLVGTIVILIKTKKVGTYFNNKLHFKGIKWNVWVIAFSPFIILTIVTFIYYGKLALDPEFISMGLFYAVILLFFGPIPEEMGWRGILFDQLSDFSFWKAQIVTSIVWLVWHFPLFFIIGSYQNQIGFGSADFFIWGLTLLFQSFIMGYLYVFSNKSILIVIVFHYLVNLSGEFYLRDSVKDMAILFIYVVLLFIIFISPKKVFIKYTNDT